MVGCNLLQSWLSACEIQSSGLCSEIYGGRTELAHFLPRSWDQKDGRLFFLPSVGLLSCHIQQSLWLEAQTTILQESKKQVEMKACQKMCRYRCECEKGPQANSLLASALAICKICLLCCSKWSRKPRNWGIQWTHPEGVYSVQTICVSQLLGEVCLRSWGEPKGIAWMKDWCFPGD